MVCSRSGCEWYWMGYGTRAETDEERELKTPEENHCSEKPAQLM